MMSNNPRSEGNWLKANKGVYERNNDFYKSSGGIFKSITHYAEMFVANVSNKN